MDQRDEEPLPAPAQRHSSLEFPDFAVPVAQASLSDIERLVEREAREAEAHEAGIRFRELQAPEREIRKLESPPNPTDNIPECENISGRWGFQVNVPMNTVLREGGCVPQNVRCIYSEALQKLFVQPHDPIPFEVSFVATTNPPVGLFIRAQLCYMKTDEQMYPVLRCRLHQKEDAHVMPNLAEHVLRGSPTEKFYYQVAQSGRYSVVTQFREKVFVMLACRSSCNGGIARRRVAIVFTLENGLGEEFGRSVIPLHISAAPKRDAQAAESREAQKRPHPPFEGDVIYYDWPPPGKKYKVAKTVKELAVMNTAIPNNNRRRLDTGIHTLPRVLNGPYDSCFSLQQLLFIHGLRIPIRSNQSENASFDWKPKIDSDCGRAA